MFKHEFVFHPYGDVVINARFGSSPVKMLASSRYLMLASPVFKSMLQPQFAEDVALASSGLATLSLLDDDPDALEIVMNIIHDQEIRSPQRLCATELANVAVFFEKYRLDSVVEKFPHIWLAWVENFIIERPLTDPKEIHAWIYICWVFKLPEVFTQFTICAITHFTGASCDGTNKELLPDLPIPQAVMDRVESERLRIIKSALLVLGNSINKYRDNTIVHCPRMQLLDKDPNTADKLRARFCDCATYEALVKYALAGRLYPAPTPPYSGLSCASICLRIRFIMKVIPSYCQELDKVSPRDGLGLLLSGPKDPKSCHGLEESATSAFEEIDDSLLGLDLRTFLPNSNGISQEGSSRENPTDIGDS